MVKFQFHVVFEENRLWGRCFLLSTAAFFWR
jgi:hypothetical protein